ncbi:MAG: hypothetical protein E6J91_52645, partial [Deltaproteobacteria bacterium]
MASLGCSLFVQRFLKLSKPGKFRRLLLFAVRTEFPPFSNRAGACQQPLAKTRSLIHGEGPGPRRWSRQGPPPRLAVADRASDPGVRGPGFRFARSDRLLSVCSTGHCMTRCPPARARRRAARRRGSVRGGSALWTIRRPGALPRRRGPVARGESSCRTTVALCDGIEVCNGRYDGESTTMWSRGSWTRMLRTGNATLLALAMSSAVAHAADVAPTVRAHAVRRTSAIAIDGRLDEAAWAAAPKHSGFVQRFPKDASAPSLETRFAVVYDDDAIFVGVWADDPQPDLIRALLTRRDVDAPADAVIVAFDSYHDRRTAYAFQLNAAGVQRDMLLFDDSNMDDTWDAVWTGNVEVNHAGWTAEYRIPLSQLRFANTPTQEWGFQIVRMIGRTGEQDSWSPWPRSAPQVVSKFGVVDGIEHLGERTRLELLPYATSGLDRMPVEVGDPLNSRYGWRRNIGLDLKYGLGPAFTLSATINPDFGQVEADPSKINLSANELFFAEKRPFFLEGIDLFKLPIGNSDGSAEGAFYSRRIGAAPAAPDVGYDFIKAPPSTTIYGAAKLTGKTSGGWSIGVLDAVTGRETAEIASSPAAGEPAPAPSELTVAPLTNYAVARLKRDMNDGATSVGLSATAVDRKLAGTGLERTLRDQAYTSGVQLQHRWADNAWTANVNLMGSYVHGSPEAIAETQTSAVHFFQRPDYIGTHFDPTRTSLSGLAAKWMVGQLGDTKHWRFGAGGDLRTAGLELNDVGFQLNADRMIPFFWGQYRDDSPGEHLLNWQFNSDIFWVQTLEPRLADVGLETNVNVQLANYWSLGAYSNLDRGKWAINALRGGHALRGGSTTSANAYLTTDTRKPVWFNLNLGSYRNWTSGGHDLGIDLGATIQARSNIDIFVGPSLYLRNEPMQYVDQVADDLAMDQTHYVFGRLHEADTSMTLRMNWTFSPHLALQVYAQPYIASGHYDELKEVDHPAAARYEDRFHFLAAD